MTAPTTTANPRLASALFCARQGWHVFPIFEIGPDGQCACGAGQTDRSPGKHPRTDHGFYDATTDEGQIVMWWACWPDANIGVRTGRESGIVVLDEDPRNGGDKTRAAWERQHGVLPPTVRAKTGGYGAHYFFAYPADQEIKTRPIGPGVEIKADGGYVVVAGSNHASGGAYDWDTSAHPATTVLAPMPDWLMNLAIRSRVPDRAVAKVRAADDGFPAADLARVEAQCGWMQHCRDDAGRGDAADPLRVTEPEWYAAMSIYARCRDGERLAHERSRPYPSYSPEETAKKFRHAAEDAGPRTCSAVAAEGWGQPYCGACPHRGKISTPLVLGRTGTSTASVGENDPGPAPRFRLLDDVEIDSLPPPKPLAGNVVGMGELAVLVAPSGHAKTFVALDLSLSVAGGSPWANLAVRQGPVLYVVAEGAAGLGIRVRAWKRAHGVETRLGVMFLAEAVNLLQAGDVDALLAAARSLPDRPILLVVDTLARCIVGAEENSAKDMGLAIAALDRLRSELGCAVLVLHHTGHNAERERGSSALRAAADTLIVLGKDGDILTMRCEKQKNSAPFPDMYMRLRVVDLGQGGTSCVVEPSVPTAGLSGNLSGSRESALRALVHLFDEEGATFTKWQRASKIAETTLRRVRGELEHAGYIEKHGTGRGARYVATTKGLEAIAATPCHDAPSGGFSRDQAPCLPPPHSFRSGDDGWDGGGEIDGLEPDSNDRSDPEVVEGFPCDRGEASQPSATQPGGHATQGASHDAGDDRAGVDGVAKAA